MRVLFFPKSTTARYNIKILRLSRYTSTSASALYTWHMHKTARAWHGAWWVRVGLLSALSRLSYSHPHSPVDTARETKEEKVCLRHRQLTGSKEYFGGFGGALVVVITSATPLPPDLFTAFFAAYVG